MFPWPPSPARPPASLFGSNSDGTFADLASQFGLDFKDTAVAAVVYDDFDNDYDLDLIVFPAQGEPVAWVNHRLGEHRLLDAAATGLGVRNVRSAMSADPDKDGDRDLLAFTQDGIRLLKNQGGVRFQEDQDFTAACGRLGGTGGQFVDMDNDGDLDLVLADATRRDGSRGPALLINGWPQHGFADAAEADPGNLLSAIRTDGDASCVVADFTGDGRCDILLAPAGQSPQLIENATPGGHWIQLDLAGKRPQDSKARSNNSAVGARVEVKTGAVFQQFVVGGSSGPVAMAPLRIHAGLGDSATVDWLRIIWPDAVLQAEVEMAANLRHRGGRSAAESLVVPLPVRLERRAVRVCGRLWWRRGTRLSRVAGKLCAAGSDRVPAAAEPGAARRRVCAAVAHATGRGDLFRRGEVGRGRSSRGDRSAAVAR